MTTNNEKKYIDFVNPKTGKKVGYVFRKGGEKICVTERTELHLFKKFNGFGVSEAVLKALKDEQIRQLWFVYKPTDEAFVTTVEQFEQCETWENEDEDVQRVMPLQLFDKPKGQALFRRIINTLKRYVAVRDEEYHILALWILHSYLVRDFGVTAYIQLTGQAGSGKSTIMKTCSKLVNNGKTGSFSEASIYRMMKEDLPTLFFNEFENIKDKEFMIEVLNNGYEEGQMMARVINDEVRYFSPFCPKMFGTVNKDSVPTLDSRSMEINTFRATTKLESLHGRNPEREKTFVDLQKEIAEYLEQHKHEILELFNEIQISLTNRPEQIIKPLATIERYFGASELVVDWYKRSMQQQLYQDLKYNKALVVLKILYQHEGEMSLKDLTTQFNEELQLKKPANYIGGILDKLNLKAFKEQRAGGYMYVNVPIENILLHFSSYNIDKELLDKLEKNASEDSEATADKSSEGSEASEQNEAMPDYLINIIEG